MSRKMWMSLVPFFAVLTFGLSTGLTHGPAAVPTLEQPTVGPAAAVDVVPLCPLVNDEGCSFADIACTSHICCCIYSCPGGGSSNGPCVLTSPGPF